MHGLTQFALEAIARHRTPQPFSGSHADPGKCLRPIGLWQTDEHEEAMRPRAAVLSNTFELAAQPQALYARHSAWSTALSS